MQAELPAQETTLRDAVGGDHDAFARLIRKHQALVFSVAWNFFRNEALAEELAQDVFLEMHRALPGFESESHIANWLRRVTIHRCIDQARKAKYDARLGLSDVVEPVQASNDTDPMLIRRLQRLTASLPEKARAVLLLRYQEDLELSEIATVLSMPLNTVKSHLQRSLAMLREKLERTKVQL